jgi:hypothetical protein
LKDIEMNAHDVTERASLLHHRIYAARIRKDPELRTRAVTMLERGIAANGGTVGHRLWLKVLRGPWDKAEALMLSETPEGRLLRSNSPFARLIGVHDTNERIALWRQAKHELSNQKTLTEPSGV